MGTKSKLNIALEDTATREAFLVYFSEVRSTRTYIVTACGATLISSLGTFPLYGSTVWFGLLFEVVGWVLLFIALVLGFTARMAGVEVHLHNAEIEQARHEYYLYEKSLGQNFDATLAGVASNITRSATTSFWLFRFHLIVYGAAIPVILTSRVIASMT